MDAEFLPNGCNCVTVENMDDISIEDFCNLFSHCPMECCSIRVARVDGSYIIILPDCMSERMEK